MHGWLAYEGPGVRYVQVSLTPTSRLPSRQPRTVLHGASTWPLGVWYAVRSPLCHILRFRYEPRSHFVHGSIAHVDANCVQACRETDRCHDERCDEREQCWSHLADLPVLGSTVARLQAMARRNVNGSRGQQPGRRMSTTFRNDHRSQRSASGRAFVISRWSLNDGQAQEAVKMGCALRRCIDAFWLTMPSKARLRWSARVKPESSWVQVMDIANTHLQAQRWFARVCESVLCGGLWPGDYSIAKDAPRHLWRGHAGRCVLPSRREP